MHKKYTSTEKNTRTAYPCTCCTEQPQQGSLLLLAQTTIRRSAPYACSMCTERSRLSAAPMSKRRGSARPPCFMPGVSASSPCNV